MRQLLLYPHISLSRYLGIIGKHYPNLFCVASTMWCQRRESPNIIGCLDGRTFLYHTACRATAYGSLVKFCRSRTRTYNLELQRLLRYQLRYTALNWPPTTADSRDSDLQRVVCLTFTSMGNKLVRNQGIAPCLVLNVDQVSSLDESFRAAAHRIELCSSD